MMAGDLTTADAAVRALLERIAGPAASPLPDLDAIGAAVRTFAADLDYLASWRARLGSDGGSLTIHQVPSGPKITLVRRPAGHMSAVHDHGTWVALAPVDGRELHRRYDVAGVGRDARPVPVDVRSVAAGSVVTLLPPDDLHDHGHVLGEGEPADLVIVTGADQTRFARTEWDLPTGRRRTLAPGQGGRWLASEPVPGPKSEPKS